MGAENAKGNTEIKGNETGTNQPSESKNSDTPSTRDSGGSGGNRGTTRTDTATEKSEMVGKNNVTEIKIPPLTESDKAEQKEIINKKVETKPRVSHKKKVQPQGTFTTEQIQILIITISSIVGSRDGMEDFILSPIEVEQIATPLANIIAKSEKMNGLNEYADHIALIVACGTIMIPRIISTIDKAKQKKARARNGISEQQKPTDNRSNQKDTGKTTPAHPSDDKTIFGTAIPSNF